MEGTNNLQDLSPADEIVPDYKHHCTDCGQTPTVVGYYEGKLVYATGLCAPCMFGPDFPTEPEEWNP